MNVENPQGKPPLAARIARLFEPDPSYQLTSWLFLKLLAMIYFAAFLSLAVQITGLVGPDGILPFGLLLEQAYNDLGISAWWKIPNIFWLSSANWALQAATITGCAFSVLLFLGIRQRLSLVILFILYLSLTHAGQLFLNFQWDYLLLETGFLAIFLVSGPTPMVIFLFHFLLFRLRFLSGLSKILSGDPTWANLTALNTYFETQPLPHIGAWYAHQLPHWLLQTGVAFTFFVELIVPFFIFMPRRFRLFAAAVTIALQLLIIATSNHNFVNLLTILLCLFLLDDDLVRRIIPKRKKQSLAGQKPHPGRTTKILTGIAAILIVSTSMTLATYQVSRYRIPVLAPAASSVRAFGLGNVYHIFPTMQTERQELEIQGSMDGIHWKTYLFKYKPGPLDRKPAFIIPHQPRLDWMIWFIPPQFPGEFFWFDRFMYKLRQGEPVVTRLLADNPFESAPPRHLRVMAYRYHFTNAETFRQTGHYWTRELIGEFPNVPRRYP